MVRKYKINIVNFEADISNSLLELLNQNTQFEAFIEIDNANIFNCDLVLSAANDDFLNNLKNIDIPIIILANKNKINEISDIDYAIFLKIPFRYLMLESKIMTLFRAKESAQLASIKFCSYEFNSAKRSLISSEGKELKLTDKEVAILAYLSKSNKAVSRDELLREVWHYNEGVTTHTLETHIYRLRQKLSTLIGDQEVIYTEEGGYSFKALKI